MDALNMKHYMCLQMRYVRYVCFLTGAIPEDYIMVNGEQVGTRIRQKIFNQNVNNCYQGGIRYGNRG